jgi:ribosomal protein S21
MRSAMAVNIEVAKNANESTANLIRRFTKRVQGAGLVQGIRRERYFSRIKSRNVRKASRLTVLARREKYNELLKLGKIAERTPRK